MSDHLPECLLRSPRDLKPESDCICDRLRAAEQRVTSDFAKYLRHMVDDDKFAAGVKAAREAVAGCQERGSWILRADALAAIDGVTTRGEGGA